MSFQKYNTIRYMLFSKKVLSKIPYEIDNRFLLAVEKLVKK